METVDVLLTLIETDSNPSLWYLLGIEYVRLKDMGNALQAFGKALATPDETLRQKVMFELSKITNEQGIQEPSEERPDSPLQNNEPYESQMRDEELRDEIPPIDAVPHRQMHVISGGKDVSRKPPLEKKIVTFADVGGLDNVKDSIQMKIIKPFVSPGLFERFRKKVGGGILLYGPPGCGKTYIAKATAGECRARFISVHISDILDPFIGVSEQNLRDVFSSARANTPCILFFDEIDAVGYNRNKSVSGAMRGTIDQFLTELDGLDTDTDKILIVGATNMPWDVDAAFKRPGRFDKMLFVPPPDTEARKVIFQRKLSEKPVEAVDYDKLAKLTDLYSGADIDNVIETAIEFVITEIMTTGIERPIRMEDLLKAVDETKPSTIEWLRTVKNYVKYSNQGRQYDDVQEYLAKHKSI